MVIDPLANLWSRAERRLLYFCNKTVKKSLKRELEDTIGRTLETASKLKLLRNIGGNVMSNTKRVLLAALVLSPTLGGCGLFVPEKDIFSYDTHRPGVASPQAAFENMIVAHVQCEIQKGLIDALNIPLKPKSHRLDWLRALVIAVQLKITVDEQSTLMPSVAVAVPLSLASITAGLTGTAHATRVETISFNVSAQDLEADAKKIMASTNTTSISCAEYQKTILIESDLKIDQFIYDKAFIATTHEVPADPKNALPYTVFSDEITFVTTFGASATPTWTFKRVTVDPASPLLNATRSRTPDVLITISPGTPATPTSAARLSQEGQQVQFAARIGSAPPRRYKA
jgi:hypothetical protein